MVLAALNIPSDYGVFCVLLILLALLKRLPSRTKVNDITSPTVQDSDVWNSLPWVQPWEQPFASLRANFKSIFGLKSIVELGHNKYSVHGVPYAITTLFSGKMLVLPQQQIRNFFSRPEHEVDSLCSQNETIQAYYTIGDARVYNDTFHFNVVRNQLTRNLTRFSESIAEELQAGLSKYSNVEGWKSIQIWGLLLRIVSGAANRVFVGPILCRDNGFLESSRKYTTTIFGGALVIRLFPYFLRPIVGRLVWLNCRWYEFWALQSFEPVVAERIRQTKRIREEPSYGHNVPADCLQWVIEECFKKGQPDQLEPKLVAKRILILNMVAQHSTSFTLANVLLDIYSTPGHQSIVAALREEVGKALQGSDGAWTREVVANLHRTDSVIRESMRYSSFGIAALPRMVSHPKGLEVQGRTIPQGVTVTVAMHQIHFDASFYSNPQQFNAWRFLRPSDMSEADPGLLASGQETTVATDALPTEHIKGRGSKSSRTLSASAVSDTFLSFGYGRHACPGRFFAVHEMKVLLSLLLQQFDFERLEERPADMTLVEVKIPSECTKMRVRRRPVI